MTTEQTRALISEAWRQVGRIENKSKRERLISELADALEAATRERDAALAAVERGRNVLELLRNYAEETIVTTHGMLSASFVKEHVEIALSALDGAPEPEVKP